MKNSDYIKYYLNYIKIELNYSLYTCVSYENDLLEFNEIIKKNFREVIYDDLKDYLKTLHAKNESKNTINRKISSVKSFFNYLSLKGYIETNPTKLFRYLKKDKILPSFIYYNDLDEILGIYKHSQFPYRDKLIMELMYATGIRVSEAVNIELKDINMEKKELRVVGKGDKERIVYFNETAKTAMSEYINYERNVLSKKDVTNLIVNKNGDKITDRGIRYIFDTLLKKSAISQHVTPHTLRHTFATHLLAEGADIKAVEELLGHTSLKTTQIYTHVTSERIRNVYNKYHTRK